MESSSFIGLDFACSRLLRSLAASTQVQHLHLYARLGYDDPADTGMLFAALAPMHPMLDGYDVRVEPDFFGATFECEAEGRVVLTPLRCLAVVGRFALSPRTWRVLRHRA